MSTKRIRRRLSMLELVRVVQDTARNDAEAVELMTHLLTTRRVILSSRITAALSAVAASV